MRKALSMILAACVLVAAPTMAHARGAGRFGVDDKIERIQTIGRDASGQEYFLGRLVTTRWFIAGVYLQDQGYVIGLTGTDRFARLTPEKIRRLQAIGELPTPLPKFRIPLIEYLLGYSLWIVVAGSLFWGFVVQPGWNRLTGKTKTSSATST